MIAMLCHRQKESGALAVAPVVFKGTPIFVSFMILGIGMINASLCVLAKKIKKPGLIVLFVLAFLCMLGMGYLSTRNFENASMNWIAECVNVVGEGLLLLGVLLMHKNGLAALRLHGGETA